jgi:hypothetical protein
MKEFFERDKYRVLLISLGAMIFIQPLLSELELTSWLFLIFTSIILFTSVYAVRGSPRHLLIAVSMLLPTLILVWLDIPTKHDWYNLLSNSSPILLFSYIAYLIFIDLIEAKKINADMIAGGISIYFMIGLIFAFIYIALFNFNHDNFAISEMLKAQKLSYEENVFVYFSYVTMTTLGYGDITPVTTIARVVVQFQVLLSQLYLAIFIARLVSMYTATKMSNQ